MWSVLTIIIERRKSTSTTPCSRTRRSRTRTTSSAPASARKRSGAKRCRPLTRSHPPPQPPPPNRLGRRVVVGVRMSAVRCPQCKLPLTEEEAGSGSCSSCGHELPQREAPEPKSKAAPTASHDPAIPWLAAGVSLLIALVAVAWGWTRTAGPAEVESGAPTRFAKMEADLDAHRTRELEHLEKIHALEAKQSEIAVEKDRGLGDSAAVLHETRSRRQERQGDRIESREIEDRDRPASGRSEADARDRQGRCRSSREIRQASARHPVVQGDPGCGREESCRDRDRTPSKGVEAVCATRLAGKFDLKGSDEKKPTVRAIHEANNSRRLIFDWPLGEYTVSRGTNGSKVRLSGTLKRLILQGLDGGSLQPRPPTISTSRRDSFPRAPSSVIRRSRSSRKTRPTRWAQSTPTRP